MLAPPNTNKKSPRFDNASEYIIELITDKSNEAIEQMRRMRQTMEGSSREMTRMHQTMEGLSREMTRVRHTMEGLNRDFETLASDVREISKQLNEVIQRQADHTGAIKGLHAKVSGLKKAIQAQPNHTGAIKALQDKVSGLEKVVVDHARQFKYGQGSVAPSNAAVMPPSIRQVSGDRSTRREQFAKLGESIGPAPDIQRHPVYEEEKEDPILAQLPFHRPKFSDGGWYQEAHGRHN